MKRLEIMPIGLKDMNEKELQANGGSVLALAIAAAAALLVSSCTIVVNTGDGDVHVGDEKENGTDVNTDIGVNV